ncbi:hypothetical protein GCM10010304_71020 [Streptomyces roseoviolaceus]
MDAIFGVKGGSLAHTVIDMKLRYNVRVYPSASQRGSLARAFGCARVVWNDALRLRREAYRSNNRRKAQQTVAKIHARIADQRRDFIEQETTRIVRESQAVYVEDLNVKGMATRGGRLGKSVLDQSFGRFVRTLEAKCARYGRTFVRIDRWFPSTQLCSGAGCGRLTGPKGREQLNVRAWTCTECGTRHDRDENAEANLRAAGRKRAAEMQHEAERRNACGEHVRPRKPGQRSLKQEPPEVPLPYAAGQAGIAHVHVGEDVNGSRTSLKSTRIYEHQALLSMEVLPQTNFLC